MEPLRIVEVKNRKDLRQFAYLPKALYGGDPYWAPPLWSQEKGAYKKKNPILSQSDYALFLARREGRVVGRNLVYIDHTFNRFYKSRTGFFGAFECRKDIEAARALLLRAERWLQARDMEAIRGPIHPIAESWGFLYDGFTRSPVFMAPYNPPYYNDFCLDLGFRKVKDLLAYEARPKKEYKIPARFSDFAEKLLSRKPNLTLRRINRKNLLSDAEQIWKISNTAYQNNWGYVPLNRDVLTDMIKKLKIIMDEDAIWFVEDAGTPVGYALGFPDLNVILKKIKGRLLPFGFVKLLTGIKKVKDYRLFGLAVLPEYQNLGLDVLLYMKLYEALSPKILRLEANYILEDNAGIRNALEKLNLDHIITYRIYEKSLS